MFNKISVTPGAFIICLAFWKCFLYKCLSQLSREIKSFSPWVPCSPTVQDLFALAVPLASKVWSLLQTVIFKGSSSYFPWEQSCLTSSFWESEVLKPMKACTWPVVSQACCPLQFVHTLYMNLAACKRCVNATWDAYSIHGYCTGWQMWCNLQETCVLLEWQVDPGEDTWQCL